MTENTLWLISMVLGWTSYFMSLFAKKCQINKWIVGSTLFIGIVCFGIAIILDLHILKSL